MAQRRLDRSDGDIVSNENKADTGCDLPGVNRGKLYARRKVDGKTVVVLMPVADRDARIAADPDVFFVTDHCIPYPYVLVRLAKATPTDLRKLFQDAWRMMGGG